MAGRFVPRSQSTGGIGECCLKSLGGISPRQENWGHPRPYMPRSSGRLAPPSVSSRGWTGAPPSSGGVRSPTGGWIGALLIGFLGARPRQARQMQASGPAKNVSPRSNRAAGSQSWRLLRLVNTSPGKVPGSATARAALVQPGRHRDLIVKPQANACVEKPHEPLDNIVGRPGASMNLRGFFSPCAPAAGTGPAPTAPGRKL
jgi:hypothetical protein